MRNLHGSWKLQNSLEVSMFRVTCTDSMDWSDCKFKSKLNKGSCRDDHVHLTCDGEYHKSVLMDSLYGGLSATSIPQSASTTTVEVTNEFYFLTSPR